MFFRKTGACSQSSQVQHIKNGAQTVEFEPSYDQKSDGMSGGVQMQNRLISTDVLMGKFGDHDSKKNSRKDFGAGTAVLSTAVIARSSSAPRLMTYESDDFAVGEIKRFWPPLRSLETLHDSINFSQFDGFLERLIKGALTPLPSPPKTPLPSAVSSDAINKTPTQDEVEKVIGKLAKNKQ